MKDMTRRDVLGPLGIVAGGCVFSSCLSESRATTLDGEKASNSSWAYHALDPAITAEKAYRAYAKGSCMYGVVESVLSQLAEAYGEPYASFPVDMMRYGAGGTGSSGSLCGALNGAAALIGLFVTSEEEMKQLVGQLFLWYEQSELPVYVPGEPTMDVAMPKSVSQSVLCHVSTTRWCTTSGHQAFSKPRKERCRRLTADTAGKTVEVLNSHFNGRFAPAYSLSEEVKECKSCHTKGSEKSNSRGTMSCGNCHFSIAHEHP